MNDKKLKTLVLSGLFAALCCVGTLIYIPSLSTNGYINLGDAFVLSSGFVLGPLWGALAGGIGSMITDLLLGYTVYAPATLIIKGLMAFTAAITFNALNKKTPLKSFSARLIASIPAEIIMALGYLLYDAYILGYGPAALASVPGNIIQAIAGILVVSLLSKFIIKS